MKRSYKEKTTTFLSPFRFCLSATKIETTISSYLLADHNLYIYYVLRLFRLLKSFHLKLLVIFNNPVHWLLCSHYCVVGLHGNHVNGNLDEHNLSPCIRIIVLYAVTNFTGCYGIGLVMQIW